MLAIYQKKRGLPRKIQVIDAIRYIACLKGLTPIEADPHF
jgi:ABC-type uncharacterized transport system ATPase subunit